MSAMQSYGISQELLNWTEGFLLQRQQQVRVNYHHHHLFESGDMAHTQAITHTHTIHNNTKEGK